MEGIDFISHMVQMKDAISEKRKTYTKKLYIPHGSDERSTRLLKGRLNHCFISHMVQMKVLTSKIP